MTLLSQIVTESASQIPSSAIDPARSIDFTEIQPGFCVAQASETGAVEAGQEVHIEPEDKILADPQFREGRIHPTGKTEHRRDDDASAERCERRMQIWLLLLLAGPHP